VLNSEWAAMRSYLMWRLFNHYALDLGADFVQAGWQFVQAASGGNTTAPFPLLGYCMGSVNSHLGDLLSHYWVKSEFGSEQQAAVLAVTEAVRQASVQLVSQAVWLDDATMQAALRKLATLQVTVGYPEHWNQMAGLAVDSADHMQNVVAADTLVTQTEWARVGGATRSQYSNIFTTTINGHYQSSRNGITLTAAISGGLFFDKTAPLEANLGGIGTVFGHESLHVTTGHGRYYDATGAWNPWWTARTQQDYQTRSQCFVEQYSQFTAYGNHKVDGSLTLSENLADSGGLRASWLAYQTMSAARNYTATDNLLFKAVFNMSREQLFYRSWALSWCAAPPSDSLASYTRLTTDVHAPNSARIRGPVANNPEFLAAFGCVPRNTTVTAVQCLMF